ncbi:P-loop containing nucleoside triphosphate hydrolase protein [Entophlyctis helioformis]|nr:P-loop containing nucleoside triphosphate hydrolase protein [Entophlyctis helioformis]
MHFGGSESSLSRLKASSEARQAEEERTEQRKRNLLVLILQHLQTAGAYNESVERLQAEAHVSLRKVSAADNMDLLFILQEFESYYAFKFGKAPKLVRKNTAGDMPAAAASPATPLALKQSGGSRGSDESGYKSRPLPKIGGTPPSKEPTVSSASAATQAAQHGRLNASTTQQPSARSASIEPQVAADNMIQAVGTKVSTLQASAASKPQHHQSAAGGPIAPAAEVPHPTALHGEDEHVMRLLKPLPDYANSELRELASIITRDIFLQNPNVKWSDIAGLDRSKRLIKEAIVFPIKFPSLFTGILKPWKGLLLFGPPGTGKTMLAKAVATECNTTFFNISASSVVSKWRGDSEKLIRVLFDLARYHAPSTIFLDELESIMGQRTSDGAEHEGSRRMKTELLIQMDGLAKGNEHVFLLAASNLPWDLDVAMLRRLEKRILIDLPDFEARRAIFQNLLPSGAVDDAGLPIVGDLDYDDLANLTQDYSGSDISLVCREAAMRPLRQVFDQLESLVELEKSARSFKSPAETAAAAAAAASSASNASTLASAVRRDPIQQSDVREAIRTTRPSSSVDLNAKYHNWQQNFASL